MANTLRVAMIASGGGTTVESILRARRSGILTNVDPVLLIVTRMNAGVIKRAKDLGMTPGVNIRLINPQDFTNEGPEAFGDAILYACWEYDIGLVGLYGCLVPIPPNVIEMFPGMMVNQHPGPLDPPRPDFGGKKMYGIRVHAARHRFIRMVTKPGEYYWENGWTEATAQRVAPEYDQGAVIGRTWVPVLPDDTIEQVAARVLREEHVLQVQVLRTFAEGKVRELVRTKPLIAPEHYEVLAEAKAWAIKKYPKG